MRAINQLAGALLACTIILPCAAFGAEDAQKNAFAPAPRDTANIANIGSAVDTSKLDSYRGGSDSFTEVLNKAQLSGTVGSNVAAYVATGSNAITDGAFSNASGIPTVIQNSGANVLIQNSLIVNLQLK
jgi:hypothetical protein